MRTAPATPLPPRRGVQDVDLAALHPPAAPARTAADGAPYVFDPATRAADAQLLASIRERGVLQAITVEPLPNLPGGYAIRHGNRRAAAARLAGLCAIPARIWRAAPPAPLALAPALTAPAEQLLDGVVENLVRAATDPLDLALALRRVKAARDCAAAAAHLVAAGQPVPPAPAVPAGPGVTPRAHLADLRAYLTTLIAALLDPAVAPTLPAAVVYQRTAGAWALTSQALAPWAPIERACGLSRSRRQRLLAITDLPADLLAQVAAAGPATLGPAALRARLVALATIPAAARRPVVTALLTQVGDLPADLLARLGAALRTPALAPTGIALDWPLLVEEAVAQRTLALPPDTDRATHLASIYQALTTPPAEPAPPLAEAPPPGGPPPAAPPPLPALADGPSRERDDAVPGAPPAPVPRDPAAGPDSPPPAAERAPALGPALSLLTGWETAGWLPPGSVPRLLAAAAATGQALDLYLAGLLARLLTPAA